MPINKQPDAVYKQLKARFQKMRDSREELERLVASMRPMPDSTPLIREDRDRDT